MEVAKVRGASKRTGNIVSFEIEPGWGMRIIPISRARG
jgi:flagellar protein FlaH